MNPLVLMSPIEGKKCLLYISTTKVSLGALLVQQDHNGQEKAIYYINKTLVGYELNYTPIEKTCLLVVFASRKL